MDMHPNAADRTSSASPSPVPPIFGIALAVLMIAAIGVYAWRSAGIEREVSACYEQEAPPGDQPPQDFSKWDKPLAALVLTGQMHGYYDPCGCSEPMHGGLTRRFNFVQSLKKRGWDVVGIDLGELPSLKGIPEQNLLKFDMAVKSLAAMNYRAFGIGRDEILMPLGEGLTHVWDKNRPHPRPLNLSLDLNANGQLYAGLNVRPFEIIDTTKPKIGVISMMGPDMRDELKQEKYLNNLDELPKALRAFADAGVEIGVILHHEHPKTNLPAGIAQNMAVEKERRKQALECAKFCADARTKNPRIPAIQLIMVVTHESEPPSLPSRLADDLPTQLVEIGHKGKYVGLAGIYRQGKDYRLQYQIVLMSDVWNSKKGEEKNNAVTQLLEKYNQNLKNQNIIAKYPRTLHINQLPGANQNGLKATFVGSSRCGDCHEHAYKIWKDSDHFKAAATLEKLTHPSGRQHDPECMKCHTTGFKHPGGYNDLVVDLANWPAKPKKAPPAKKVKEHNDNLRGVGCESCHGPGSEHVKNPNDAKLYKIINPDRNADLDRVGANLCMKCHDAENDVHFGTKGHTAADKWKKIAHPTPKKNNGGVIIPPAKKGPVLQGPTDPPFVIEVIEEKKK